MPPARVRGARAGDARGCSPRCSPETGSIADASRTAHRREGSGLVAAFLQWHLERGVRSLRHVERVKQTRSPVSTRVSVVARSARVVRPADAAHAAAQVAKA